MLEYSFNELDNDFITLWSKALLMNDVKPVLDDLVWLAKMGQVDALKKYLLLTKKGKSKWIDKVIKEVKCDEVDSALIKSYYDASQNNRIKEFAKYQALKNGTDEGDFVTDVEISKELIDELDTNFDPDKELLYNIEQDLKNSNYITQFIQAVQLCYEKYKETENVLYAEKCLELCYSETSKHLAILKKCFKPSKAFIENTRTKLIDLYNKNPEDVVVAFYLAKSLLMFNDENYSELKYEILKNLSERKLLRNDIITKMIYDVRLIGKLTEKGEKKSEPQKKLFPHTNKIMEIINCSKK